MAHVGNKAIFMLDADASPGFQPSTDGGLALVRNTAIIYYHIGATNWTKIDLAALSGADGNNTVVVRGDSTVGVEPTVGEAPLAGLVSGDTASIYLTNGTLEYWVYNGAAWVLGFTTTAQTLSNALTTLSGVAAGSVDLGTFTGTTIPDASTIKAALQALETVLETSARTVTDTNSVDLTLSALGNLSADVKRSVTQHNVLTLTEDTDGLEVTTAAAPAYATIAAAFADVGLASGAWYALTITNLEGFPSAGTAGPFYRKP